jgi:hypothetical protein
MHVLDERLDKWPDSARLGGNKQMSSPLKKKKLDYPDGTEGSRLAARIRHRANKMTSAQREECLKKAMQIYYGGQPKEAARS